MDEDPTTEAFVNEPIGEFDYDDTAGSGSWAHGNYQQGFGGTALPIATQEELAVAVKGWIDDVKAYQSISFQWEQITMGLFQYDAVGPIEGWGQVMETSTFNLAPKIAGTISTASVALPPQIAICASHYTAGSGSRNRGRIFIPYGIALADGLVSTARQDTVGALSTDLFDDIAAVEVAGGTKYLTPAVVSKRHQTFSTITSVRVGDEADTQRRRRNYRAEVYRDYTWPV